MNVHIQYGVEFGVDALVATSRSLIEYSFAHLTLVS